MLEKDLARTVAGYSEAIRQVKWSEVRSALKPEEAAVEFVHYKCSAEKSDDSTWYAALVLRPSDKLPQFVPLFEAKELMTRLRGATGGSNFLKINALYAEKTGVKVHQSLYKLIWQPLDNLLKDSRTVYCSPSGLLHRLNLAAITNPNGQTFGAGRHIVVVGSTRQLVVPVKNKTNTSDAYLAGGIRYDTDSTSMEIADIGKPAPIRERTAAFHYQPDSISITRGGVLDYLPATGAEVREIGQMLRTLDLGSTIL